MATNITWHGSLPPADRARLRNQRGFTVWFTGLSASGKSTIAAALEDRLLRQHKLAAYRLDGDNIRFGLNRDLGFSPADRTENIRRIGEVARLFADSATIAITSFISPYRADRQVVRDLHEKSNPDGRTDGDGDPADQLPFIEVYVKISVDEAEKRDPKGLYKKARAGLIADFTGVSPSAPYEEPTAAEIVIESATTPVDDAIDQIIAFLEQRNLVGVGSTV